MDTTQSQTTRSHRDRRFASDRLMLLLNSNRLTTNFQDHSVRWRPTILSVAFLFLFFTCSSADQLIGNSSAAEWRHPANCTGYACDYRAQWQFMPTTDEIRFTISTKYRNKWTGIGFSDHRQMKGTDAVLGLVEESGRYFLMDTFLSGYQAPPLDAQQNIHNMSVWRENGLTHLQFHRYRRTDDPKFDFQFSDRHCAYFHFPVRGGVFNAVNKRMRKHEQVPIVSERKICVRNADYREPEEPSTPAPGPRTSVRPRIPSRFKSRSRSPTTVTSLPPVSTVAVSLSSVNSTEEPILSTTTVNSLKISMNATATTTEQPTSTSNLVVSVNSSTVSPTTPTTTTTMTTMTTSSTVSLSPLTSSAISLETAAATSTVAPEIIVTTSLPSLIAATSFPSQPATNNLLSSISPSVDIAGTVAESVSSSLDVIQPVITSESLQTTTPATIVHPILNSANDPQYHQEQPPPVVEVVSAPGSSSEPEERPEEVEEDEEIVEEEEKPSQLSTLGPEVFAKPVQENSQPAVVVHSNQPGLILVSDTEETNLDRKSNNFALDWQLSNLHVQLNESQLRLLLISVGVGLLVFLLLVQCCCSSGFRRCCCGGDASDQSKLRAHDLSNSSTLQDKQKLSLAAGHLHPVGGFAGQPFSAYHEYQTGSTHSYEKLAIPPPEPPRKSSRSNKCNGGWPKEAKYSSVDPLYQSMARSSKDGKAGYAGSVGGSGNSGHYSSSRPYSTGYGSSGGLMRFMEPAGGGSMSSLQPDFYFMPHQRRYSGEVVRVFVDYDNPM